MTDTTTQAGTFEVVTEAAVHYETRSVDKGRLTWTVTADDISSLRYQLETPRDAASRIARHWHLDRLEETHRTGSLEVGTVSVTEVTA